MPPPAGPTAQHHRRAGPDTGRCAFVDYAGVYDRWLTEQSSGAVSLPTTVTGSVKEHTFSDGTAEISVRIVTSNALVFVLQSCEGFGTSPVLFGFTPAEVLAGATPSLADVTLVVRYTVPSAGLAFKDLIEILHFPAGWLLTDVREDADSRGVLRASFGVPDGTPGTMSTRAVLNLDKVNGKPLIKQQVDLDVE